jgi:hypothetical protein
MRLVGTSEWIAIGVLIAYIAFTPGFPVVRDFLSTGVGKAIGLAVFVAVWKYVSHPVALLLLVNFIRCSGMRESMENGTGASPPMSGTTLPENTYCPENYSFDNGQCKNKTTSQTIPATVCLAGQTWDGAKCAGSSAASTPPSSMPPPPSTSSTTMKQPFSNMTPYPVGGGVQPSMPEKENFAPA